MKLNLLFLLLIFTSSAWSEDPGELMPLASFSTDKCSLWPESNVISGKQWEECCTRHDLAYWMGGTRQERRDADEELMSCVGQKGDPINGLLMWLGTRFGGRPYYHTSFRWGYGWPQGRNYKPLSKAEKRIIKAELEKIKFPEAKQTLHEMFPENILEAMTGVKISDPTHP